MTESPDNLQAIWQQIGTRDTAHDLQSAVKRQTWRFYASLVIEIVMILAGITVPLAVVLHNPEPFWIVWALDLWIVVIVSAWFVFVKAWNILVEAGRSTKSYSSLMISRHRNEILASRWGIVAAAAQFVILPALAWWQISAGTPVAVPRVMAGYALILAVMAIYIVVLRSTLARAERQLQALTDR